MAPSHTATAHRRSTKPRGLGGPEGNERLTALTGAVLLVLLAAEGLTLLRLGRLLYWHFFLGFLLIGPVCLKIGSTVYRFSKYYTRDEPYVHKGPPQPLLRIIGPFIVLTTITVLATGVLLGIDHQPRVFFGYSLLMLHKLSFLVWVGLMGIHVLAYLPHLPKLLAADAFAKRSLRTVGGRGIRYSLLVLSLGTGVILAIWGAHLYSTWHRFG
jgi:hypothetical protein